MPVLYLYTARAFLVGNRCLAIPFDNKISYRAVFLLHVVSNAYFNEPNINN